MQQTFAIIKPDAFAAGNAGKILARIYAEGFKVVGIKKLYMSKVEAEGFYYVHKERPFFGELTDFMSSGPCIVMALEAEGAIKKWRDLMGATNPAEAEKEPCARSSVPVSVRTPRTVPMHRKRQLSKSLTFSRDWNFFKGSQRGKT